MSPRSNRGGRQDRNHGRAAISTVRALDETRRREEMIVVVSVDGIVVAIAD